MPATAILMVAADTFEAEARGVSYRLRLDPLGRWELTSQRIALRAARMGGGVRHFPTLKAVGEAISAFRGIDLLTD
jgi:hypothetical protein